MTDERIIAYLLNELPEEEAAQFEEECFAQASWPDQINLVEEDLIDSYLRGGLSREQHQHFERNYLSTEARLERVLMAAALLRLVDAPQREVGSPTSGQASRPSRLRHFIALWNNWTFRLPATAALGLLVVIGGAWWFLRSRPMERPSMAIALTISADGKRGDGDGPASVKLSPDVAALSIHLKMPEQATGRVSRVELVNEDGEVRPLTIEARDAGTITVSLPAAQLVRGPYSIRVFTTNAGGVEQRIGGSYFFVVVE
jgi:hypothetical protein